MSRSKIFAIITAISVSACLYACGSDDDTNPGGAGSSGHAGKAGSGGAGKGGTGGGGKPSGGSGNEAGEDNGSAGEGGADNVGGAGGDTGAAGDGNGAGGDGGSAGGGSEQTLAEACKTSCGPSHTVTDCSSTVDECNSQCSVYPTQVAQQVTDAQVAARLNAEYLDLVRCMATHLTTTPQYICAASGTMVGKTSPATATVCEDELCKWTCDDGNNGTAGADTNVFDRCGC